MQNPISGTVIIKCKTRKCDGNFGGFVFDLADWKENFSVRKLKCEMCGETHDYSRDDLTLTPAQVLE
jgi:hypothetical protein